MTDEQNSLPVDMSNPLSILSNCFFGSYDHSIDGKGRIIIPNAYRKGLGDRFTLTIEPDDAAIAIYSDESFAAMITSLFKLNRRDPNVQRHQDHITRFSYPGLQADVQGRVLLPAKLRQYVLGDAKDVEISGAYDHIRIVTSSASEKEDSYYREHLDEIRTSVANADTRD